jgi:plastocyanin
MSSSARTVLCAALLAGLLALGAVSAVALGAAPRSASHARRGGAHRSSCARHARRHARRARRCRAKAHRKAAARLTAPRSTLTPTTAAAPAGQSPPRVLAAAPAPVAIAPLAEANEASHEAPAPEPEPPSIPHVQVSAVEYSFSLSRTSVPAGEVVLEFVNDGQDEHNLHLEGAEGPLAESIGDTPSKGVDDLHLEMRPGSYTLFCSLPTHEARGMKATLTVE